MVFFFVVANSIFILIVFMLTLSKDDLYIEWPLEVIENITMSEDTQEVRTFLTLVLFAEKNRARLERVARHEQVLRRLESPQHQGERDPAISATRLHCRHPERCGQGQLQVARKDPHGGTRKLLGASERQG